MVNPSGGLISKGHPLGATGLAQCSELTWQLRGQAEKRQVDDVDVALQHNIGLGGAAVVTIYRRARVGCAPMNAFEVVTLVVSVIAIALAASSYFRLQRVLRDLGRGGSAWFDRRGRSRRLRATARGRARRADSRAAAARAAGVDLLGHSIRENRRLSMATTIEQQTGDRGGARTRSPSRIPPPARRSPRCRRHSRGRAARRWPRAAARAQPGWQELGFDGTRQGAAPDAEVGARQRRALHRHARLRERQDARGRRARRARLRRRAASASGPRTRPSTLADEKIKTSSPFLLGRKVILRYEPVGLVGVIGPWNYPFTNTVGDAIPALAAGNSVIVKPSSVTPMTSLLIEEGLRECGIPEDVFQVVVGRGPIGLPMIDLVDFVMFTGSTETGQDRDGARCEDAHARVARARRQGPDDRARRRRPRAGGQRRAVLVDAEHRPDVHLGRACVRRGADLRRVRLAR